MSDVQSTNLKEKSPPCLKPPPGEDNIYIINHSILQIPLPGLLILKIPQIESHVPSKKQKQKTLEGYNKKKKITNVGMEKSEYLYIVNNNIKLRSHFGKQFESSSKVHTQNCFHMT